MGCHLCDDCSDCPFGCTFGCDSPEREEPRDRYDDDDDVSWDYEEVDIRNSDYCEEDEEDEGEVNSKSYCTNCGAPVDESWKYCLRCGGRILKKYCVNCGEQVNGNWGYCPRCGTSIPEKQSWEPAENTQDRMPSVSQENSLSTSSAYLEDDIPF